MLGFTEDNSATHTHFLEWQTTWHDLLYEALPVFCTGFSPDHGLGIFSTAVWATAVLIQSVDGEQKLQTADFQCTPALPPPPRKQAECVIRSTTKPRGLCFISLFPKLHGPCVCETRS